MGNASRGFVRYFTKQEEKQLFKTIKLHFSCIYARRDFYWMMLARCTGVRLTVLSGLTVSDAERSLRAGYLLVRGEINKRNKEQELYLVKRASQALRELLKIHNKLSQSIEWDLDDVDPPLILSRNHKGMSPRSFQDRMKKWVELAGLEAGTPHYLRHTWAKRALANSRSPDAMRRIQHGLGHEHFSTTAIYTHPDKEDMREIFEDANQ